MAAGIWTSSLCWAELTSALPFAGGLTTWGNAAFGSIGGTIMGQLSNITLTAFLNLMDGLQGLIRDRWIHLIRRGRIHQLCFLKFGRSHLNQPCSPLGRKVGVLGDENVCDCHALFHPPLVLPHRQVRENFLDRGVFTISTSLDPVLVLNMNAGLNVPYDPRSPTRRGLYFTGLWALFGAIFAAIYATSRMIYANARGGYLPSWLALTTSTNHSLVIAQVASSIVTYVIALIVGFAVIQLHTWYVEGIPIRNRFILTIDFVTALQILIYLGIVYEQLTNLFQALVYIQIARARCPPYPALISYRWGSQEPFLQLLSYSLAS
ncbi:hypothetical protein M427DRAFT_46060 [Gonapodya prolifera JEL478]|uniref:Amino acid permease/ SLC12A domain-containing protein n=1 Tax=Gonapodya prolifera (strain JEL478) TaxID=1344416 RepID=A0A139A8H8_GONPJ|nr:hypothetical protein M427DRAFT_46060 [Gonapodya prolifera JEL478]|eukprot:KXS12988.1 hypothetical protein M427DRAFT_46060 [Gonapodya prolifera JEL478]